MGSQFQNYWKLVSVAGNSLSRKSWHDGTWQAYLERGFQTGTWTKKWIVFFWWL